MDGSSYLILLPSLSLPHVQWPLRQLAQKGGLKKHSSQGTCTRPIKPSSSLFLPPLKKRKSMLEQEVTLMGYCVDDQNL